MKKLLTVLLVVVLAISSLAGCGKEEEVNQAVESSKQGSTEQEVAEEEEAEQFKIKIATWYAEGHPQIDALNKFKSEVENNSEGNITVEIYPNSQLGSEEAFIDSIKKGSVEMGVPGTMMAKDLPKIAIVEMPFLFDGWDHVQEVLRGPIGEEITDGLIEASGVRPLAWNVNGYRVISSNYEIAKFEDLKNMRLRVPGVEYYIKMAKAFGANPTPMAFSELFTALEQKVVDGQDNPYPTVRASKLYEVQDYLLDSKHIFSPNLWVMNEKFYQSLPEDYKTIVNNAVEVASDLNWSLSIEKDTEDLEWLKEEGVVVTFPDEEFKRKLKESQVDVHNWFYDTYPGTKELAEKILK